MQNHALGEEVDSLDIKLESFSFDKYVVYDDSPFPDNVDLLEANWSVAIAFPADSIQQVYMDFYDAEEPSSWPMGTRVYNYSTTKDSLLIQWHEPVIYLYEYIVYKIYTIDNTWKYSKALHFIDLIDEETKSLLTGIHSPTVESNTPNTFGSHGIFDLSGRRLSTPPVRGIYIRDGKKVIVK